MPRNVLKRNGNTVSFNEDKIKKAVSKAAISVNKELKEEQVNAITAYVVSQTEPGTTIPIKKIQDLVEEGLMNIGEYQIAKSYILFRNEKDSKRDTIGAKAAHLKKRLEQDHKVFEGDKLREFVYLRTYSRWLDKEGRRETWVETVNRYMAFMASELGDKLTPEEYAELEQAIKNMEVLPSMRLLWSAGEAAKKNNVAAYNCSYMGITCPEDLADLVFLLMSGTGVGVSVEKQFIDQFPEVHQFAEYQPQEPFFVEDSKEGWAEVQKLNITNALLGKKMVFDFSQVRPAGARLKLSGGRSSGPDPLKDLLSFTYNKIHSRRSEGRLRPIDIYDIVCKTAEIVLCGGTRRSAIICIFDKDDHEMMNAKQGQFWTHSPHRSLSNNSVIFNDTPDSKELLSFWKILMDGSCGEPGIVNREGSINRLPERRKDVLSVSDRKQMGYNPCVPDYVRFLTPYGQKKLRELTIGDKVWSGKDWVTVTNIFLTGTKPVYRYHTTKGHIDSTTNHPVSSLGEIKEVDQCSCIDIATGPSEFAGNNYKDIALLAGLVLGDGSKQKNGGACAYLNLGRNDGDTPEEISEFIEYIIEETEHRQALAKLTVDFCDLHLEYAPLPERVISEEWMKADSTSIKLFLRGLFSANGTVLEKYKRVVLKSTCLTLIQQVQLLLSSIGLQSYYTINRPTKIKFSNGEYLCKQSYDLNIMDVEYFREHIGFIQEYKTEILSRIKKDQKLQLSKKTNFTATISNKEYIGEILVYDFTVDSKEHVVWCNGLLIHNCAEVFLTNRNFCNLTTVVVRPQDTRTEIKSKIRLASLLGTFQSTLTSYTYISSYWKQNAEKERLLGVSLTGIYDNAFLSNPLSNSHTELLEDLKKVVVDTNIKYSNRFDITASTATTCCKPEGSSSLLANSSSGISPRYSPYYIRRIRITANDPLLLMLKDQGVPCHPEVGQREGAASTYCLEFPVKAPEETRQFVSNISTFDQLTLISKFKKHYTEHSVSATVHIGPYEWIKTLAWVEENWDDIGGLAFLPKDDNVYQLAPYEEITKEEYEQRAEMLKNIDFSKLPYYEFDDNTTGAKSYACQGGHCEL